jgi:hypothetical protein
MQPIKDDLPYEINTILNSPEFDDEAGIIIESVKFDDKNILLVFSIRFAEGIQQQFWQIIMDGVQEEKIVHEWIEFEPNSEPIEVYNKHFLLLEYTDNYTELYLKGTTQEPEALFIDVFESINVLYSERLEASKYVLPLDEIKRLSVQEHGLFARGPKTILKIYEQCLIKYGIKPIFIGEREPSSENKSLKLLKLGNSYFIGNQFQFERI